MPHKHSRKSFLPVAVWILSLCIALAVTGMYIQNRSRLENARMEQIVMLHTNKINDVLTKLLYKTHTLAVLAVQDSLDLNTFNRVAETMTDDPAIKNFVLAPDGVVRAVYPLAGNEAVLGLDFFEPGAGNQEALQARDSGQLVLGGPFDLLEGGQALVGRLPVYTKDAAGQRQFWGLVCLSLHYPQVLDAVGLDSLQEQGFSYEIWRISPETAQKQIIAHSDFDYDPNGSYVEREINLSNAHWQFRISPVKAWYNYPETWVLGIGGILLSCLVSLFVVNAHHLRQMKNELELLSTLDPLTGALNRRGVLAALDTLLAAPDCRFTLCYMDLNKFKAINDRFGHSAGDHVLRRFAAVFEKRADAQHLFARMGGDEFLLILQAPGGDEEIDAFFRGVRDELSHDCAGKGLGAIPITFSLGLAHYPGPYHTVDDLLSAADSDMYQNKLRQAP